MEICAYLYKIIQFVKLKIENVKESTEEIMY